MHHNRNKITSYSSIMDFNKLNSELYQESAPSRFAKKPTSYDKGYLKISDWLGELCFHFEQKRKNQVILDEEEFRAVVKEHMEKIEELEPSEYKDGLLKVVLLVVAMYLFAGCSHKSVVKADLDKPIYSKIKLPYTIAIDASNKRRLQVYQDYDMAKLTVKYGEAFYASVIS